jgi:UNC-50 family
MMTEDPATSTGSSVPHVRKTSRNATNSHNNDHDNSHRSLSNNSDHPHPSLTVAAGNAEQGLIGSSSISSSTINAPTMTPLLSTTAVASSASSSSSILYTQQQQRSSQQQHHHNLFNSSHTMHQMNLHRLYDVRQMDIQSALDQMKTLISTRPQLIYKTAYYRKQTKNHWYRDDPAFHCIQIIFLLLSCIAYSIAFKISFIQSISFILTSILWNYLLLGIIIATTLRELTNRHLLTYHHHPSNTNTGSTNTSMSNTTSLHIQRQQVEWFYAFDIHCNAFFPLYIVLCTYIHFPFGFEHEIFFSLFLSFSLFLLQMLCNSFLCQLH